MHTRGSGAELGDLLSAVDCDQLAGTERRMFDLIQTDFIRRQKVPQDLAVALAHYIKITPRWTETRPRMMCHSFYLC